MNKEHWDKIYSRSKFEELGWHSPSHKLSIEYVQLSGLNKKSRIIDIGCGNASFAEQLIDLGYQNVGVLDISKQAIEKAKERLGKKSDLIHWIQADVLEFNPKVKYDFWHDRALFHFFTEHKKIKQYKQILNNALNVKGKFMLATFSESGPNMCSGLPVTQYTESTLMKLFTPDFHMIRWQYYDHITPGKTKQNYLYSCFSKL